MHRDLIAAYKENYGRENSFYPERGEPVKMKRMKLERGQAFELLVLSETIGHTYFICQERRVHVFESGLSGEKRCQTKIVGRR